MNLHEKVYQLTEQLAYYLWEQLGSPSGSPELDREVAEQIRADSVRIRPCRVPPFCSQSVFTNHPPVEDD